MLLNLKVPDEVYEVYARRNPESPRTELEASLKAFARLDPKEVVLFLNQAELREVSMILGHPIQSFKELEEHLRRSERASLGGGVEVAVSPSQRARFKALADFNVRDFKEYVSSEVKRALVTLVGP